MKNSSFAQFSSTLLAIDCGTCYNKTAYIKGGINYAG